MEILEGIEAIDLGLYLKKEKALIIADTHLGYEAELNRQGVMIPRLQFTAMMKTLEKIIKKTHPDIIIINGDIKHRFGRIEDLEWRSALKLIDFLRKNSKKVILIKGNHDKVLDPIATKKGVEVETKVELGDKIITHGDKIIETKAKTIIIGHEHPAITIQEGARKERFKCFLVGKYKTKNLIIQPSFNRLTEGTDILSENTLSPYLDQDLSNFKVFIVADDIYDFGKLGEFSSQE